MSVPYGSDEYKAEVAEVKEELQHTYGTVWNTEEVQKEFEITGFGAPQCAAIHKSTGIRGKLTFRHSPRFYFDFRPLSENEFAIFEEASKIKVTEL